MTSSPATSVTVNSGDVEILPKLATPSSASSYDEVCPNDLMKAWTSKNLLSKEFDNLQECCLLIFVLCRENGMHSSIKATASLSFFQPPFKILLWIESLCPRKMHVLKPNPQSDGM